MPWPPAGPVPEDDLADEARFLFRDDLGEEAAHRQTEQVDQFEAKGADEPQCVPLYRCEEFLTAWSPRRP
jgi:hypothetical protein